MRRLSAAVIGALCVMAAAATAWYLAYPQNSLSDSIVRVVADGSAVVTLGLVLVPTLDARRHRDEMADRAARPLIVASAGWTVAELVRLFVGAAQAEGTTVSMVGVRTTAEFVADTAAGRAGLVCVVAAALVCTVTAVGTRTASRPPTNFVIAAGAAAMGVAGRSLVGHLAESPIGGVAVAVHTLAAATWCGVLAALVLTVSRRGQWARVLPRFSRLSLVCVVVLVIFGTAGAAVTLGSPADLYATGYGRVLAAKIVVTAALIALAWRNRAAWLPAAQAHRATAKVSRVRSRVELAAMAVALTLAAALAVTG